MKRISMILALICAFGLVLPVRAQDVAGRRQMKVISFNLRTATADKGTPNHWENRKDAAAALIVKENPTVFGVQEAVVSQLDDMKKRLPDYEWVGVGRNDGVLENEIMAIFYKKTDVKLLDWGTFWLSETPDVPSKGWDAKFYRTATWAVFKHKPSGKRVFYINTHLDHQAKTARMESIKLICKKLEELNPRNYPAFITADFNSDITDPIFDPLKEVMSNARDCSAQSDSLYTFNRWGVGNPRNLDNIFISPKFKSLQYRTIQDQYLGVRYVSDHYPISALLEFE